MKNFNNQFQKDQIFLVDYHRIQKDPENLVRELYGFLEVNNKFNPLNLNKIVNKRASPRFKLIAKFARKTAELLRQYQLYGILTWAHNSNFIKSIVFQDNIKDTIVSQKI